MATLQIGAVYLWSYVFNIVRASSFPSVKQFDKIHVDESSIETPKSELGSCKEPLLASENQADQYALRSSASDEVVSCTVSFPSTFSPFTYNHHLSRKL
jgi:hypothetical protein